MRPFVVGVVGLNLIGETFRLVGGDVILALFGAGLLLGLIKKYQLLDQRHYKHSV